ncbi:MAG: hypothetical protein CMI09_01410 [Oceanospirillaceae bacterium]|nr:hypothetical protein [Oceanospirillaceae bacterium]|tara:strand:- start:1236 stop:1472 length:237 start_codon:yes stop_codon:yes gene_type:complete
MANHFSELPEIIRCGLTPTDIVFSVASPMDDKGYFSLGLAADYTMAAISLLWRAYLDRRRGSLRKQQQFGVGQLMAIR